MLESSLGHLAGGLGCEDTPKDIVFPSFCNTINPKFSTTQKKKKDWFHKKCVPTHDSPVAHSTKSPVLWRVEGLSSVIQMEITSTSCS